MSRPLTRAQVLALAAEVASDCGLDEIDGDLEVIGGHLVSATFRWEHLVLEVDAPGRGARLEAELPEGPTEVRETAWPDGPPRTWRLTQEVPRIDEALARWGGAPLTEANVLGWLEAFDDAVVVGDADRALAIRRGYQTLISRMHGSLRGCHQAHRSLVPRTHLLGRLSWGRPSAAEVKLRGIPMLVFCSGLPTCSLAIHAKAGSRAKFPSGTGYRSLYAGSGDLPPLGETVAWVVDRLLGKRIAREDPRDRYRLEDAFSPDGWRPLGGRW